MPNSSFPPVDLTNVTGTLPVANGGTALATLTAHALYAGNGTSAPTAVAVGTTGQILTGVTGGDPAFSSTVADTVVAAKGTGAATGPISNTLTVNTTQAGTTAVTTEETLWTYDLPANTLSANGKAVRITIWGTTAANTNSKTIQAYFGSTSLRSQTSTTSGVSFFVQHLIVRTGASAQVATGGVAVFGGGVINNPAVTTPSADTTAAITIKFTGTNGTASANDIVFRGAIVEVLN